MKRIFSILFIFIYLFSVLEIQEYFKVPALIEHYTEHQQEDKTMTLWKFLCMHYAHGDVKDADYEKDMKLPFKSLENCNFASIFTLLPENKFIIDSPFVPISSRTITKFSKQFLSISTLNSIWQPPKNY